MALIVRPTERTEEDSAVILTNTSGVKVRLTNMEARVLAFVDGAADAQDVGARAQAANVRLPVDHIRMILKKLAVAGIVADDGVRAPPLVVDAGEAAVETTPPGPGEWSGLGRTAAAAASDVPADAERTEAGSAADARGQENLRRELRRMRNPMEYTAPRAPPAPEPRSRAHGAAADVAAPLSIRPAHDPAPLADEAATGGGPSPFAVPPLRATPNSPSGFPAAGGTERVFRPPVTASSSAREPPTTTAAAEAAEPPKPPRVPVWRTHRRPLLLAAGAVSIIAAGLAVPLPSTIERPARIAPARSSELRAAAAGKIDAVLVSENTAVAAGQPLMKLSSPQLVESVAVLQSQIAALEADFVQLESGQRPDLLRQHEVIAQRSAAAKAAIEDWQKISAQHERGKATAADVLSAETQLSAAKRALVEAHVKLSDLKALGLPGELAGRKAMLERARAQLAEEQQKLAALEVKSPVEGIVIRVTVSGSAGTTVREGDLLAEVARLDELRLSFRLRRHELAALTRQGQLELRFPNGRMLTLPVQSLRSFPEQEGPGDYVRVEADVDNSERRFGAHTAATARLNGGWRPIGASLGLF